MGSSEDYNVSRPSSEMADYPHGVPPETDALSPADVQHFIENGYAVLRGYFDAAETEELREAMGVLLRKAVPERLPDVGVDRWLSKEGQTLRRSLGVEDPEPDAYNPSRVTYIDNVHKYSPVLHRHLRHPRLLRGLSELLGEDIDAFQCATVAKPSQWDGEDHGWHQDTTY